MKSWLEGRRGRHGRVCSSERKRVAKTRVSSGLQVEEQMQMQVVVAMCAGVDAYAYSAEHDCRQSGTEEHLADRRSLSF
jgi:hypothetical protein